MIIYQKPSILIYSAGSYVKKKCPVYLYLLKAIFLFQLDFRVPKMKEIEVDKILTHPIPQNFFTVSEIFFSKYLDFFASNRKISLSAAKNYKKL